MAEAVTRSTRVATSIIAELIQGGVRDIVVCPGSRSQALALAAAEAERRGLARLHVRVDERSAAFFALGIGRETGVPAPVIVTSGTAVANLLPAALEAQHARIPLLLLTADRPEELRHGRTSQTISDLSFLAGQSRAAWNIGADVRDDEMDDLGELVASALRVSVGAWGMSLRTVGETQHAGALTRNPSTGRQSPTGSVSGNLRVVQSQRTNAPGMVHVNVEFREPLSGGDGDLAGILALLAGRRNMGTGDTDAPVTLPEVEERVYTHGTGASTPRSVVIAGAEAGPKAEAFAHAAQLPLLAEPSSGARFGPTAIQHWATLLSGALGNEIERVIVFGHPTLTRVVPRLVGRVPTVLIDPALGAIERFNPRGAVKHVAQAAEVSPEHDVEAARAWLGRWVLADRDLREDLTTVHEPDLEAARQTGYKERSAYARAEVARLREPVTREHLTETVWLATWPHDRLVIASSRLIRVLNRMAQPRNIRVAANRGLAGIDGTIATALGIASASQSHEDPRRAAGTTRVIVGDLAFVHDVGSLALTEGEPRPRIQVIVGHDGGGSIFDELEVAATANPSDFDRVMYTPQNVGIAALAQAYGWSYKRVATRGELERVLTAQVTGPEILEVPIAR